MHLPLYLWMSWSQSWGRERALDQLGRLHMVFLSAKPRSGYGTGTMVVRTAIRVGNILYSMHNYTI